MFDLQLPGEQVQVDWAHVGSVLVRGGARVLGVGARARVLARGLGG